MTQDEIIRMAREAGFNESGCAGIIGVEDFLERFAALVAAHERENKDKIIEGLTKLLEIQEKSEEVAIKMIEAAVLAEREACADLCYKDKENNIVMTHGTGKRLDMLCAAAIRARGESRGSDE